MRLYSFCPQTGCADGANPSGALVQGSDGNFYGTTASGGAHESGTVFRITPAGRLTTLHSFAGWPKGGGSPTGLVQGIDGNLYGTTSDGGPNCGPPGCGTVFKITRAGKLTTLHSFTNVGGDGIRPDDMVQATDGNFYGTTFYGGRLSGPSYGTVFRMTPRGALTIVYDFCAQPGCADGAYPNGLVQATDGNFYGTTNGGEINFGTVFKITASAALTTLHSFGSQSGDGTTPAAALIQATDGDFYGTTTMGGNPETDSGTIFKITPAGKLTTLFEFGRDSGGGAGGLIQATNGKLYGETSAGGASGYGTVFSLAVGLGPFVETQPTSGKVGAAVKILGTNLTGARGVSFNGTGATFTVVSSFEIKTTVPAGATTGKVEVKKPSRTLSSNVAFRVPPSISSFSPTSGPVDASVVITGESLTGATSVTFGGVKATSFKVDSDTKITATVPTGAKTGKIGVTTPGGTATSAGTFTVN